MTDLLRPVSIHPPATSARPGRPLAVAALLAGLASPAVALSLLWFVGLVGWYADDGGSAGTTRSVLRVGADAWLLAHGSPLAVHQAVVTASPLGLTVLCGLLTYRLAVRAGTATDADGLRSVGLAAVVLSGTYAVVALLVAVLAGVPGAEPGLGTAFLGGAFVGLVFGGAGLLRGAGRAGELRRLLPVPVLSIGYAAVLTVLAMVALGALLTVVGLVTHWTTATEVVEQLDLDLTGGLLSLVLLAGIAPNVVLLASTYLLGPGFAFGAATVVSPSEVSLGPVPSVPVLAALPDDGWAPGWVAALVVVPVLAAGVVAFLVGRALPTRSYQDGAVRGLGGGAAAGVALTVAAAWAGGSIGPGRMSVVGVSVGETLVAAVLAFALGGVVGAVVATWWARRRDLPEARHPERQAPSQPSEPSVVPSVGSAGTDRMVPRQRQPGPRPADLGTEDTVAVRLPADPADSGDEKDPPAR